MRSLHLAVQKTGLWEMNGGKQLRGRMQSCIIADSAAFLIHNLIWKCQSGFNPSDGQVYLPVMLFIPFTAHQCPQSSALLDLPFPLTQAVIVIFQDTFKSNNPFQKAKCSSRQNLCSQ